MTPRRWCFLLEAQAVPDALLRILDPFAVQGAELAEVVQTRAGDTLAIRLEAEGLAPGRAEHLLRRLQALPVVRRAGLGWRTAAGDRSAA